MPNRLPRQGRLPPKQQPLAEHNSTRFFFQKDQEKVILHDVWPLLTEEYLYAMLVTNC